jgi:hypothetical protein
LWLNFATGLDDGAWLRNQPAKLCNKTLRRNFATKPCDGALRQNLATALGDGTIRKIFTELFSAAPSNRVIRFGLFWLASLKGSIRRKRMVFASWPSTIRLVLFRRRSFV